MTDSLPRIVFMGTPEFAVASLRAVHKAGYSINAVVTAPDKPAGRGRKITVSPVKKYALEHGLRLLQPEKLRDPDFTAALKELDADIFVVVAFRMLPETVWRIPRLGTFNLHASMLPQYRGAAPINHAIINGETSTGVTTFLIDKEIDTGMILLSRETEIAPDDDAGSLHDRLMKMGAALVVETVAGISDRSLTPVPQKFYTDDILKPAPKILPADTIIDWKKPAVKVHNLVRGLSPHPGATTMLRKGDNLIRLKVLATAMVNDIPGQPAAISIKDKLRFMVYCGDGTIEILSLLPEGRKLMTASDFLRGFDIEGWVLT